MGKPTIALTREEVQERLGITKQTFWIWVKNDPMFITYKLAGNRVMDPADLEAWITHRKLMDNPQLQEEQ